MSTFKAGLAVFVIGVASIMATAGTASAQQCYRLKCDSTQACKAEQTSSTGDCCCNVSCEGLPGGGTTCTCTTRCGRSCAQSCTSCAEQCVTGLAVFEEPFVYTRDAHARLLADQPLAAAVLSNISGRSNHPVYSGSAQGKSSVGGKGDFAYKVRLTATPAHMVMEFVFEGLAEGLAPEPVRVDIDNAGFATATLLAASDTKSLSEGLQALCLTPKDPTELLFEASTRGPDLSAPLSFRH